MSEGDEMSDAKGLVGYDGPPNRHNPRPFEGTHTDPGVASFSTGAVRSTDGDELDLVSLPWLGLLDVARTAREGATKYGEFNYFHGFPARSLVSHALKHLLRWTMGDRSEPHLEHAAWGLLVLIQQQVTPPDLLGGFPGPGYTLSPELVAELEAGKADRAARRAAGEFDDLGKWTFADLKDVVEIVAQREAPHD